MQSQVRIRNQCTAKMACDPISALDSIDKVDIMTLWHLMTCIHTYIHTNIDVSEMAIWLFHTFQIKGKIEESRSLHAEVGELWFETPNGGQSFGDCSCSTLLKNTKTQINIQYVTIFHGLNGFKSHRVRFTSRPTYRRPFQSELKRRHFRFFKRNLSGASRCVWASISPVPCSPAWVKRWAVQAHSSGEACPVAFGSNRSLVT